MSMRTKRNICALIKHVTLYGRSLKLVNKFTYLGSSVSSTETDIDTRLAKAWTAINSLSVIWKSELTYKMKHSFFQAAVVSILLNGCTTWTLTKRMEKKLDGNYTRMLQAILHKSWRQHSTKHQLYGHLPPITKTIKVRRTWHAGHCWRSRDELIGDVLPDPFTWPSKSKAISSHLHTAALWGYRGPAGTMNDREGCEERVRNICADDTTRWWWVQFWKKCDKSKFSWLALLFKHVFNKKNPPIMHAQKTRQKNKKRQRIYDLINAKTKPTFLVYLIQNKKKSFLRKIGSKWLNKNKTKKKKRRLFTCSLYRG